MDCLTAVFFAGTAVMLVHLCWRGFRYWSLSRRAVTRSTRVFLQATAYMRWAWAFNSLFLPILVVLSLIVDRQVQILPWYRYVLMAIWGIDGLIPLIVVIYTDYHLDRGSSD